jgi:hypothetical protein
MTEWSSPCELLASAESSLRNALAVVRTGDASGVLPAARAFFAARDAVAATAPTDATLRSVLERHREVLHELDVVSAAFHEAAHCPVADALGLGIRRASIARTERACAFTDLAPYDPHLDGPKRS